jgi:hypothetical protein
MFMGMSLRYGNVVTFFALSGIALALRLTTKGGQDWGENIAGFEKNLS